jgi:hypothetical protein
MTDQQQPPAAPEQCRVAASVLPMVQCVLEEGHEGEHATTKPTGPLKLRDASVRVHPVDDARVKEIHVAVSNAVGRWANKHPEINKHLRFGTLSTLVDGVLSALPQLSSSELRTEDLSIFRAYNQAIEDAKAAIRGEKADNPYAAATFINAIARKCSPHRYVTQAMTEVKHAADLAYDARANTISECVEKLNALSTLPFDAVPYIRRDDAVAALESLRERGTQQVGQLDT